ncbi:hypothetical protein [Synechococcus sp. PCC 7336]|uniref:hypothetical protein n=1 Tax=Synechococcus sp. PCC 7336 TaxID=195250 RepID=UPI00034A57D4|nr:hypothetical protein [Synechococcus sp. PCC 7336]
MSLPTEFVTVATFNERTTAALARQYLQLEGVEAQIIDDATVSAAWHLTVAAGWIKLQVRSRDKRRAIALLEAKYNAERQADVGGGDDEEDDLYISPEDRSVDRAYRAAIVGLIVLPMQFYALLLSIRNLFDARRMSPNRYFKAIAAGVISSVFCAILVAIVLEYLGI